MSIPTKPGFYWVEYVDDDIERTEVVEVRQSKYGMWVCFASDEWAVSPEELDAKWGELLESPFK